jgi:hypothetical protein
MSERLWCSEISEMKHETPRLAPFFDGPDRASDERGRATRPDSDTLWQLCAFPLALNSGRRSARKGKIILNYGHPRDILCVYLLSIPIFDALNEVAGVVPATLIEQRPSKPRRQHGQQVRVAGTMIRQSY